MRQAKIAFFSAGSQLENAQALWKHVEPDWPHWSTRPRAKFCVTEQEEFSGRPLAEFVSAQDVIVAVCPPGYDHMWLGTLLDAAAQAATAVVVLHDAQNAPPPEEDGSLVRLPLATSPSHIAAVLAALAARQPAVRALDKSFRMAQSFQGETAAAIEEIHQELLLAAKVQRDFLPKALPELDGVHSSVLYRPATFVSGDTYSISQLDGEHIGFFLADAMGHGVPAALMTLYLSGSLPQREPLPDGSHRLLEPSESLTRLNADLSECMEGPTRFATAIAGVVNARTGVIKLAAAGHPPPLRVSPRGVKPVDVAGMLLGVVADETYEHVEITLEPDELLVIYSDGIENVCPSDRTTSDTPAYYAILEHMRSTGLIDSVDEAMARLTAELDRQSGSMHLADDLTVLALATAPADAPSRRPTLAPAA